ncbi:MAG: AraC family ligand binding domain-containing protein [Ferruginibacter sp.]
MKKIPIREITLTQKEISGKHFSIRQIQDLLDREDLFHELHRHNFFFMIALQKGKGIHEIDFTTYTVCDNSVFFLRPGQVHQLQLKAGFTGYLIEFDTGFYHPKDYVSNQRLRKAGNKNFCKPALSRFEKLYKILTHIFQEYADREDGFQDVIKASLDIFFIEFLRQSANPNRLPIDVNPYTQERLEEFLELLEIHFACYKQVSQYTDLMNLSPYQLNEITKVTVGENSVSVNK